MKTIESIPKELLHTFRKGTVIPAMPLALHSDKTFDKRHQKAILRYYIDAGAGGIAVGVHSTQFEIRDQNIGLFEPVLSFASDVIDNWSGQSGKNLLKIAGVSGPTEQAKEEARLAESLGYHACLVSLSALKNEDEQRMIEHCKAVAGIMPIIGFYLQPAVGGVVLPYHFWRSFAEIDNVLGIKVAPFNRYYTLDVVKATGESDKTITLYTGNDDNIVMDLLTPYHIHTSKGKKELRLVGGLLGHWGFWTRKAVELLEEIQKFIDSGKDIPQRYFTLASQITEANAAVFDPAHHFDGVIPGIHEILRKQGLLEGRYCLDPDKDLSPGQKEEIDRIYSAYPHLNDDAFVKEHLNMWLSE